MLKIYTVKIYDFTYIHIYILEHDYIYMNTHTNIHIYAAIL
jgi:hypothetical protein